MGGEGGDAPPPRPILPEVTEVAPENVGRTGYGPLRGNRESMYSMDVKHADTYPEDITPLELKNWYNYSLRDDYPSIMPSVEENRRIWQDMDIERMLDHTPTHEIHPTDLPNYHYWPGIQNELSKKVKETFNSNYLEKYQEDATAIPRFFRTGVPKTPIQEQYWYIPLKSDGRFNYRLNNEKNGYSASLYDKKGWDKRYFVELNRPAIFGTYEGFLQFTQGSIAFRQNELPIHIRVIRHIYGSTFDRYAMFGAFYLWALAYMSQSGTHYVELNFDNEPWNYDMEFSKYNRDKGGFHGLI